MNSEDAYHWNRGREKVEAGLELTDREREVLTYFGGASMLHPKPPARVLTPRRATTPRPSSGRIQ